VVVGDRPDGDRVEPGLGRRAIAQAGRGDDPVEDAHDLGAERPGELPVPAGGGLAGDAALLVGGGAKRQPGVTSSWAERSASMVAGSTWGRRSSTVTPRPRVRSASAISMLM
jgi:hypothetical protein